MATAPKSSLPPAGSVARASCPSALARPTCPAALTTGSRSRTPRRQRSNGKPRKIGAGDDPEHQRPVRNNDRWQASQLSGSNQTAIEAARYLRSRYPNAKVVVRDLETGTVEIIGAQPPPMRCAPRPRTRGPDVTRPASASLRHQPRRPPPAKIRPTDQHQQSGRGTARPISRCVPSGKYLIYSTAAPVSRRGKSCSLPP